MEEQVAKISALVPVNKGAIDAFSSEDNFAAAQRMAKGLAASSLVPAAYQNNIPNVLIAMELATRIGASVFAVMQNLDVIHGRPGWRSTFIIATVNSSGRFTPLRFRWEGTPGTDGWGCRAVAKDRETGEECLGALITILLAKAEGWYARNGSKWKTIPEQMLMYRSASFWGRIYAPEKMLGMYTREEVDDSFDASARTVRDAEIVPSMPPSPELIKAALEQAEAQAAGRDKEVVAEPTPTVNMETTATPPKQERARVEDRAPASVEQLAAPKTAAKKAAAQQPLVQQQNPIDRAPQKRMIEVDGAQVDADDTGPCAFHDGDNVICGHESYRFDDVYACSNHRVVIK